MWDWKVTPFSSSLRSLASDITWKPPESVEDRPWPVHEAMQAAKRRDALGAGTQHEVIGVGEHDIGAERLHRLRVHRFHRRRRADRHEGGRANFSARQA